MPRHDRGRFKTLPPKPRRPAAAGVVDLVREGSSSGTTKRSRSRLWVRCGGNTEEYDGARRSPAGRRTGRRKEECRSTAAPGRYDPRTSQDRGHARHGKTRHGARKHPWARMSKLVPAPRPERRRGCRWRRARTSSRTATRNIRSLGQSRPRLTGRPNGRDGGQRVGIHRHLQVRAVQRGAPVPERGYVMKQTDAPTAACVQQPRPSTAIPNEGGAAPSRTWIGRFFRPSRDRKGNWPTSSGSTDPEEGALGTASRQGPGYPR